MKEIAIGLAKELKEMRCFREALQAKLDATSERSVQ